MAKIKYYVLAKEIETDDEGGDEIKMLESDADVPLEYSRRQYMVTAPAGVNVREAPFIGNNRAVSEDDGGPLVLAYGQVVTAYGYYPQYSSGELWIAIDEGCGLFAALKYKDKWLMKEV